MSTSWLCFTTPAHDKGVGDERYDIPFSTRSWRWAAAGSGVPHKKPSAGWPWKWKVCNGSRSCSEQTVHFVNVFLFISTSQMLYRRKDAVLICWLVGWLVWFLFHYSGQSWWRTLCLMFWKHHVCEYIFKVCQCSLWVIRLKKKKKKKKS